MKKLLIIFVLSIFCNVNAQDKIILIDGENIECKIIQVGVNNIKYEANDYKTYIISKSMIKSIIYDSIDTINFTNDIINENKKNNKTRNNKNIVYAKIISAKDSPIESRISAGIILSFAMARKTETVYYFYSKDGTSVQVDRITYHKYEVGDSYIGKWR